MRDIPSQAAPLEETTEVPTTSVRLRAVWMRRLLTWHWISSAFALFGMLLFAVTGITLNHAGQIAAEARVTTVQETLPEALMEPLLQAQRDAAELPLSVGDWLLNQQGVKLPAGQPEWSEYEVYLSLPRPGGDAWLSIDLETAELLYESTDRGWIAYLNDLHKGRNAGQAWSLFIDFFALVCVVFSLTGLAVLWLHARERAAVWPVTGLGVLVPVLLAVLLVH
ncbi:PepSY-associated TM helix domain-containing protein [Marinobacterium marinum]|uniref:PepSY-associated TM helix domain-containing protein n=1 Tax=Marinobacterium marinum TaxID=2756129 RepID=A0A7W2ABM2_9GAMM|nr:PepSY-associated TM helix domain-containing protein [Marinobacterium marinum]MBA4503081.1 PepSY-associated TM helix domain-containing protein [Marinobacterium marinum]